MMVDEMFTIKQYEKDGWKYHDDISDRYKTMEVYFPIYKYSGFILGGIDMTPMDNLKLDYPLKFAYEEFHNEKVLVPVEKPFKPTPQLIYEDELSAEEEPEYKEGITTKTEKFNPEFTVQVKLSPNSWGEPRKLMRLVGWKKIPIERYLTIEEWEQFSNLSYWREKITEDEYRLLLTKPVHELYAILISQLEKPMSGRDHTPAFIQVLFGLPSVEYKQEPIYEEDKTHHAVTLKDVDIDYEVIGEDYTHKGKIASGSYYLMCNPIAKGEKALARVYSFKIPLLPFICDWFNVPMPEEKKKKKFFKRGED